MTQFWSKKRFFYQFFVNFKMFSILTHTFGSLYAFLRPRKYFSIKNIAFQIPWNFWKYFWDAAENFEKFWLFNWKILRFIGKYFKKNFFNQLEIAYFSNWGLPRNSALSSFVSANIVKMLANKANGTGSTQNGQQTILNCSSVVWHFINKLVTLKLS